MAKQTNENSIFDVKKDYKYLYSSLAKEPEIVEVPDFKHIMIDGKGYPGTSEEFGLKVQVLYGLSYTIKFMMKKDSEAPFDFKVAPLSGLWRAEDMTAFIDDGRKEEWLWTMMVLQPDPITQAVFDKAAGELKRKKNPLYLDHAYLKVYEEGLCAQILHIGPYNLEKPTIEMLHRFIKENGYTFNGGHHELYLSDPNRTSPEKLKTIIRQPIRKRE
jgi:hypothetical protein